MLNVGEEAVLEFYHLGVHVSGIKWDLCQCGKKSLAEITNHSCLTCFEDYANCPDCFKNSIDFTPEIIEHTLAENLEDDGPWMI